MGKKVYPFRTKKAEEDGMKEASIELMRKLPTSAILSSMEVMLGVLRDRGQEIRDFDNKEKVVQQIRMVGLKAYFLAAEPEEEARLEVAKYESELKQMKENNRVLVRRCRALTEENSRLLAKGGTKENGKIE